VKILHDGLIGTNISLIVCIKVGDISITIISCFAEDSRLRIPLLFDLTR